MNRSVDEERLLEEILHQMKQLVKAYHGDNPCLAQEFAIKEAQIKLHFALIELEDHELLQLRIANGELIAVA